MHTMPDFFSNILPAEPGVYIVGGSVRDLLLGRCPTDFDIAVQGDPARLVRKLAQKISGHVIDLGKPGKQTTRVAAKNVVFDIAPIVGQSIEEDLCRRDFTINAMACESATGKIIDPSGGKKDLSEQTVRMVSERAFIEDPIRLIRTFRIAAALKFKIEPNTLNAVKTHAKQMAASPGERIRPELIKILETANAYPHILQMAEAGLLQTIFPEMELMAECSQNRRHCHDVFDHSLNAFRQIEVLFNRPQSFLPPELIDAVFQKIDASLLKLAVLLHDIGKPCTRTIDANGAIHFYGHEKAGTDLFLPIARRIKLSNKETDYIALIIENHLRPLRLFTASRRQSLSRRSQIRFFMKCKDLCPALLIHAVADARAKTVPDASQPFAEFAGKLLNDFFIQFKPESAKPPLITGRDLMQTFNLSPSPLFKKLLQAVEEARLTQSNLTRAQALDMVGKLLNASPGRIDNMADLS